MINPTPPVEDMIEKKVAWLIENYQVGTTVDPRLFSEKDVRQALHHLQAETIKRVREEAEEAFLRTLYKFWEHEKDMTKQERQRLHILGGKYSTDWTQAFLNYLSQLKKT